MAFQRDIFKERFSEIQGIPPVAPVHEYQYDPLNVVTTADAAAAAAAGSVRQLQSCHGGPPPPAVRYEPHIVYGKHCRSAFMDQG